MSLVGRLKRSATTRAATTTLSAPDGWLKEALGAGKTYAGKSVNVSTALGLAPFYRGVQILSGSVGMLPCKVYRKVDDEQASMSQREFRYWLDSEVDDGALARPHPSDLARGRVPASPTSRPVELLHDKPNRDMAADEFWALMESHLDTWGNAFAWQEYGQDERLANLWPLAPSRVSVGILSGQRARDASVPDGTRFFYLDGDQGRPYFTDTVLHFRGLSPDGIIGYSPVHLHRQQLGAALAKDEFAGRFWANDATPGVTLIHPDKIKPEAISKIKDLWNSRHRGGPNRSSTAVLGENISVHQMTMPLKDAQYIEGMRMDATQQALILGIPPYMVAGDNGGNSLTYTTTEGQSLDLLKWTLSPRLVRIQNVLTQANFMPRKWYAEFEPGAIMRATTAERYGAWAVAPHLTVNEMREMDNLPPHPDGEKLSKSVPAGATEPAIKTGDEPAKEDEDGDS